jgi:hypothetical protein
MSLRQSDEDVGPIAYVIVGEMPNRVILSPDAGRLQIALAAARRVFPIGLPKP